MKIKQKIEKIREKIVGCLNFVMGLVFLFYLIVIKYEVVE